jgi:hypothetical protein
MHWKRRGSIPLRMFPVAARGESEDKGMDKRPVIIRCAPLFFFALLFLFVTGCGMKPAPVPEKQGAYSKEALAVVGFRAALVEGDVPQIVRDPFSGAIFWAEPVPPEVVREMTTELFERLKSRGDRAFIPPGQALGAYSRLASEDLGMALLPAKMLQEIGKTLGADLVLAGFIFQWKERQGTDYAVSRPASVSFDLHLVRSKDGKVIWNGKFEKTQQPLSQNILDLKTFLEGKGRWMTASKLASLGLDRVLATMP